MPATVHRYSTEVSRILRDAWPRAGTGEIVGVWLDLDRADRVRVVHLGSPIGTAGTHLLARVLEPTAGRLEIDEDALAPVEAEAGDAIAWLPRALELIRRARAVDLRLCITLARPPDVSSPAAATSPDAPTVRAVIRNLSEGADDLTVIDGNRWSVAPSRSGCTEPAPEPAPAVPEGAATRPPRIDPSSSGTRPATRRALP